MKVNYVLMYGSPYLKYKEFETFEDISKFLVNKRIVNYSIFKKLKDDEEVEMIYRDNDIRYLKEENEELKDKLDIFMLSNKTKQETIDKFRKKIDVVSQRIGDFRLFFDEDGKMISGADSIMVKLRYYKALLDNKVPLTMTPYEYSIWEKENRKGDTDNE